MTATQRIINATVRHLLAGVSPPALCPIAYVLRDSCGEVLAVYTDLDTDTVDTAVREQAIDDAIRLGAILDCMAVP